MITGRTIKGKKRLEQDDRRPRMKFGVTKTIMDI